MRDFVCLRLKAGFAGRSGGNSREMDSRCDSDAARRARTQLATLMRAAIGNEEVLDAKVLAGLRDYQRPGEPDFLTHLLSVFLDDLSLRLESIRNAQARGDRSSRK